MGQKGWAGVEGKVCSKPHARPVGGLRHHCYFGNRMLSFRPLLSQADTSATALEIGVSQLQAICDMHACNKYAVDKRSCMLTETMSEAKAWHFMLSRSACNYASTYMVPKLSCSCLLMLDDSISKEQGIKSLSIVGMLIHRDAARPSMQTVFKCNIQNIESMLGLNAVHTKKQ